ncbi:MAG: DUF364 domain-containing protein [Pseudomonadota bacterium]
MFLKAISSNLTKDSLLKDLEISCLFLSNSYNLIQLKNSFIGIAKNYYKFKSYEEIIYYHSKITSYLKKDKLLINTLLKSEKQNPLFLSLKLSLLSAIYQYINKKQFIFFKSDKIKYNALEKAKVVDVVGFSYDIKKLLKSQDLIELNIIDNTLKTKKSCLKSFISELKKNFPQKKINLYENLKAKKSMKCDFAIITASTICNNTIDETLSYYDGIEKILFGISANILAPQIESNKIIALETIEIPKDIIYLAMYNYPEFNGFFAQDLNKSNYIKKDDFKASINAEIIHSALIDFNAFKKKDFNKTIYSLDNLEVFLKKISNKGFIFHGSTRLIGGKLKPKISNDLEKESGNRKAVYMTSTPQVAHFCSFISGKAVGLSVHKTSRSFDLHKNKEFENSIFSVEYLNKLAISGFIYIFHVTQADEYCNGEYLSYKPIEPLATIKTSLKDFNHKIREIST